MNGSIKTKEKHYKFSDEVFEAEFAQKTLSAVHFTHEAHLRLAWIHLQKYGLQKAQEHLTEQIKAYAENLGIYDKYNETLTIAAIRMVEHFRLRKPTDSFPELLAEFPQLKTDFKALLESHYSFDVFKNKEARARFIEPDLLQFD
ncbi:hypothetical protein [Roseivirga pacifica]|uniref:hypothetical protein n=1 Tax=Roseivirga pacifica TaxID=1267423 RepID=UPI00227D422F|nr:hypothetical protein [Roseivirga pacifica]